MNEFRTTVGAGNGLLQARIPGRAMSNQDRGPRNWVSHIELLLFDPRDKEVEAHVP